MSHLKFDMSKYSRILIGSYLCFGGQTHLKQVDSMLLLVYRYYVTHILTSSLINNRTTLAWNLFVKHILSVVIQETLRIHSMLHLASVEVQNNVKLSVGTFHNPELSQTRHAN